MDLMEFSDKVFIPLVLHNNKFKYINADSLIIYFLKLKMLHNSIYGEHNE